MVGYSGTPLAKKLGIQDGHRVYLEGAPAAYRHLLEPLPANVAFSRRLPAHVDLVHFFTKDAAALADRLPALRDAVAPDGTVWVSWPKKASRVETDVTEDVVRQIALPLGLVDVKVCAVDEVWSGLKLVLRLENRAGSARR